MSCVYLNQEPINMHIHLSLMDIEEHFYVLLHIEVFRIGRLNKYIMIKNLDFDDLLFAGARVNDILLLII